MPRTGERVGAVGEQGGRAGHPQALGVLLRGHDLADDMEARVGVGQFSQPGGPLLVAADWPGFFPAAPATVRLLIEAGADPNADAGGDKPETPLHWTASSDDADVPTR
jgi:hypothetical protein